jgi:hypothetical protein
MTSFLRCTLLRAFASIPIIQAGASTLAMISSDPITRVIDSVML